MGAGGIAGGAHRADLLTLNLLGRPLHRAAGQLPDQHHLWHHLLTLPDKISLGNLQAVHMEVKGFHAGSVFNGDGVGQDLEGLCPPSLPPRGLNPLGTRNFSARSWPSQSISPSPKQQPSAWPFSSRASFRCTWAIHPRGGGIPSVAPAPSLQKV